MVNIPDSSPKIQSKNDFYTAVKKRTIYEFETYYRDIGIMYNVFASEPGNTIREMKDNISMHCLMIRSLHEHGIIPQNINRYFEILQRDREGVEVEGAEFKEVEQQVITETHNILDSLSNDNINIDCFLKHAILEGDSYGSKVALELGLDSEYDEGTQVLHVYTDIAEEDVEDIRNPYKNISPLFSCKPYEDLFTPEYKKSIQEKIEAHVDALKNMWAEIKMERLAKSTGTTGDVNNLLH